MKFGNYSKHYFNYLHRQPIGQQQMKLNYYFFISAFIIFYNPLAAQWDQLPSRMWEDTLHAPFLHGVASGDPLQNAVIIWTRVNPPNENATTQNVSWQIAKDRAMKEIIQLDIASTTKEQDWTIKVDVTQLESYTTYFYQFEDEVGNKSAIGKTKTAPSVVDEAEALKFAVVSCSSIFSGYFNAYANIAQQDAIDLVIHLGDYIYDYADEDEQFRIPIPSPVDPQTKNEFHQRHRYYLLDPDLRAVRQNHPFFCLWDNHDIYKKNEVDLAGSIEAFYNYLPIRQPDTNQPKNLYRKLEYGTLADIFLVDAELHRNLDSIEGTGSKSLLGNEQYEWLTNELDNSTATWHIIGNQKLFSNWAIDHVSFDLPFGNGEVADPSAWDGFPEERERLLNFLRTNNIDNNIIISGDMHMSIATDLVANPKDSLEYNPLTGNGAVGVEFLPASVSRGNVDEQLGLTGNFEVLNFLVDVSFNGNPHQKYLDLFQHGYGLLNINADSTIAQFKYADKLVVNSKDTIGKELVILKDENHWRSNYEELISSTDENRENIFYISSLSPNPAKHYSTFNINVSSPQNVSIKIFSIDGKLVSTIHEFDQNTLKPGVNYQFEIETAQFKKGLYLVHIQGTGFSSTKKLLIVDE